MMIREFVDRTGFEPTATEYAAIEEKYYSFDGSKDEFCKAWVKDGGIQRLTRQRAEKIADLEKQILEERRVWQEQMKGAQIMVEKMREQLDRELEWKPAENAGTGMSQEDYEELAKIGTCLTVQEAEKFLYTECGFAPENILILDKTSSYEVNKYRRLRESGTWERKPVYCSSDYNYIRFNCMGWQWELINGELQRYY